MLRFLLFDWRYHDQHAKQRVIKVVQFIAAHSSGAFHFYGDEIRNAGLGQIAVTIHAAVLWLREWYFGVGLVCLSVCC